MNQKFKRNVFFLFLFLFFGIGNAQITIASDNAGNYGSWTNGSNGGTGFGPWTISTGAKTGVFIGNPSSNGMGTSGIGTTAFGLWATGNQYVTATRDLDYSMQIGDEFSFHWATNWDPNGGSKGIDLRDSSNNNIITLLHSGTSAKIVASGSLTATISTIYDVEPMLVTITRTSGTQYTINITRRNTSEGTYTSTFNSSVAISRINLFNGKTNQNDGRRNTYFNNFIQKRPNTPTIITSGSISAFSNTCVGASSAQQSYTVSGANLTANLEITAPTHFQISTTSGSGFGSSLSLSPSSGTVSSTTIYVRFSPSASGAQSGNITHTSTGATTQNIAVSGTANAIPSAPTASATQVFCGSATVANLTATGTSIQWYSASTGGTPLSSSTVLVNGNKYYASQTVSGCESPRTEVTVTINALPSVPSATGTTICSGSTATISATSGTGETIDWYASATGGTALASGSNSYTTPALTSNTTYFAEARNTITGCRSVSRTAVTVTVSIGYATTHIPTSTTTCSPGAITVRGEVYAQFITDTLNSQGAPMVAEFGYGTSTDPSTWANWSTATYIGNGIENSNNDLYEGSISGITTNKYYYGFRFRISSGCTYYYAGNGGSYPSKSMGSIVINSPPTTSNAGSNQTVCGAATLAANTPTVGTGTWSVNKGTTAQFSSVNSPTATFTPNAGAGNYILTWTIASAGCTSSSSNVTITYNVPSATLSTSNSTQTIVLGNPIGNINYTLSNITSASATGLPPGVTGNLSGSNFTISGTPTTTGIFNYNVMFNTSCGTTITANGSIRVNSNLVTFANIQLPKKDETIPKGSSKSVFAHIIAPGTNGTGQSTSPAITAWIGYTTNATDATNGNFTSGSWVWVPAPYNTGYDSSPSYQITKDEYWVSDFGQTTGYQFSDNAGDYYFVSRFQIASETGYIYGGSDGSTANISGGIWNGSNFVARKITVQECATNTWNGSSWSQGTPTIYHKAVIAENYSGNSFEACECEVNSNKTLTIGDGKYVKLKFGLVVNTGGNVIVESDGGLIQVNDASVNTGNITVKRNAKMKRLDYTYWGSPVLGQNLRSFSSGTLYTRFYVYNESNDYFDGIFAKNLYPDGTQSLTPLENSATYNYVPGKGYAVRAPNNYTTSVATFNGAFVGVPNNGEITFNLQHTKQGFNLVSNPYPSNIDFDALYSANQTKIYQTAYFWTNVNPNPIMQGSNYPSQYKGVDYYNNYAVYNGSGGVAATSTTGAAGVGSATPNQYIKIGQGFIIKAKPEGNNESLIFKNNVRTENTTGHFFNARKANAKPDRFWLTLSTPLGVNNDLLIAYKENATNDFELDYDAPLLTSPPDSFYSVLGDQKLMIQGRKYPLVIDDKVILGQRFYQDGIYKIAIKAKEGIFASGQNIYLKDKLNGTFTNLQTTDYTFNATQGESTDRFEIVYQPEGALGTSENIKYGLRVYQSGEYYVIEADKAFKEVKVYDASGRLLSTIKSGKKQLMIEKNKLVDGFNLFSIIFADDIVNKKVISK